MKNTLKSLTTAQDLLSKHSSCLPKDVYQEITKQLDRVQYVLTEVSTSSVEFTQAPNLHEDDRDEQLSLGKLLQNFFEAF